MDISGRTVWQQASGDTDRDYSDLCFKWDVILNGPGYAGPWPDCKKALEEDGISRKKISDLSRFCEEIRDGDIIILRSGTSRVLGAGQVVGGYEWHDEFGDVDGWNIQHLRRVRWVWAGRENPQQFDSYALNQGDTTQKLDKGPVMEWLESLHISDENLNRPLIELPESKDLMQISLSEVSEYLFEHGVASLSITELLDNIGELVRLAKWYQRSNMPSEHETVTYLVVPLLRSLGWTPQRMAIEWNKVDLALFKRLPRNDDSLMAVVEGKRMDASCLTAMSQAMSYAEGKSGCQRLIVTDGLRYGIYLRDKDGGFSLFAYMNLTRLRYNYPIYECKGAREALLAMSPEWEGQ